MQTFDELGIGGVEPARVALDAQFDVAAVGRVIDAGQRRAVRSSSRDQKKGRDEEGSSTRADRGNGCNYEITAIDAILRFVRHEGSPL